MSNTNRDKQFDEAFVNAATNARKFRAELNKSFEKLLKEISLDWRPFKRGTSPGLTPLQREALEVEKRIAQEQVRVDLQASRPKADWVCYEDEHEAKTSFLLLGLVRGYWALVVDPYSGSVRLAKEEADGTLSLLERPVIYATSRERLNEYITDMLDLLEDLGGPAWECLRVLREGGES